MAPFNSNNQIVGLSYDAAGNLMGDGLNSFVYDAEGNVLSADNAASQYVYDALNQRIRTQTGSGTYEYLFDFAGRRVSTWVASTGAVVEGRIYMDGTQIAYRANNGQTFFEHQDWQGTERLRTGYQGNIAATESSLAYGDRFLQNSTVASAAQDNNQFAGQEYDQDTGSDHAQFRQYSSIQGRWQSPDPYNGSYDFSNPQSLNRYNYALGNPLTLTDWQGLDPITPGQCNLLPNCVSVSPEPPATDPTLDWGISPGPANWGLFEYGPPEPLSGWPVPSNPPASKSAPNNGLKQRVCSAIPSGRTMGASWGLGGVGSVGGGGEVVMNYNSGQVSAFSFGGVQAGWNGGASGSVYGGPVYGLNDSNSNYSGGFTGLNGGAGLGGFVASSSGGLTGGAGGLGVHPSAPGSVTAFGGSFGGGALGGFSGGATATNYSNPFQLGRFSGFGATDFLLYAARQVCK